MSIGSRLKKVRVAKKLSMNRIAAMVSITKGGYSKIENDLSDPKASTLVSLSKQLGFNLVWLLTGEGEMFTCNKEDNAEIKKRLAEAEEELRQLRLQYASLQDQNEELNQEIKDRLRQIVGLQAKLIPNS
jgi:transcriptional regulator with XRE-family HTH domain